MVVLVGVDTTAVDVDGVGVVETEGVDVGVALVEGEIAGVEVIGVVPVGWETVEVDVVVVVPVDELIVVQPETMARTTNIVNKRTFFINYLAMLPN